VIDARLLRRRAKATWNALASRTPLRRRRRDPRVEFSVGPRESVRFHLSQTFQSRNEATAHLLLEALKTVKYEAETKRKATIFTGDKPPEGRRDRVMAYSAPRSSPNVVAVPDFVFWNWPDIGIHDYTELVADMLTAGAKPPTDPRLFWIGNPKTHPMRDKLLHIAGNDSRVRATGITWMKQDRPERWASDALMETANADYVSLPDHCRYKYLIDIEGAGYSARLKILLFSGRPVFLQERPWREFYFDRLEPYRHYIPVKRDMSDLATQLDWAEANAEKCREIACEAQAFAKRHLTRAAAIAYFRETLVSFLG